MNKRSIEDIQDLKGKRVLMRVDFNVPMDKETGEITDETRIMGALPSIKYLYEHGAKVILCSHLGRPKGEFNMKFSLAPVAKRLGELVDTKVIMAKDVVGEDAKKCVIEICSLSKTAGFTGTRCAWSVFPKELEASGVRLGKLWERRQATKFNGVPYIVQRGAEAALSEQGQKESAEMISYYMGNAAVIAEVLTEKNIKFYGGKNSPYLWLKCPDGIDSWAFFDKLLSEAQIVGTPGAGFGQQGEGYFRLTSFGSREATVEAAERLRKFFK